MTVDPSDKVALAKLLAMVESTTLTPESISFGTAQIHTVVLGKSPYVDAPNFTKVHPADVELLFNEYDSRFFEGNIRRALGSTPLRFGLSRRMTSAGGKTARHGPPDQPGHYEISVSTTLLFGCFGGQDHRELTVSGIACSDRLEALQRVMEHELVHLIEMLLWKQSSCSQDRFQSISRRFFGHTENKHQLITPKETAFVKFGIRPGSRVRFRFEGVERTGIVNRVNRRATVLVEEERGQTYSNGKRYARFYVPVQLLEMIE